MHKVAAEVQEVVSIPLIHIADATAMALKEQKIDTVGLLGTAFTMEQDFYKQRLVDHGIRVIIPDAEQRKRVHDVIYQELCLGKIKADSKRDYQAIVDDLASKGAQGVILGCTEIGLLLKPEESATPLFDTTHIHATSAVDWALD